MLIFLAIALSITGLIHWFLYARLVGALDIVSLGALWTLRITAIFLAISYFLAHIIERHCPEWIVSALYWLSTVWMGLMWELLWMGLGLYVGKQVLVVTGIWSSLGAATIAAIGRYTVFGVIGVASLMCGYGMVQALGSARIAHVRIPVKELTPELADLKIVMASDFHAGVMVGRRHLDRMANQMMSLKPDLILLPGDILDRNADRIMSLTDVFRRLEAPLGVYGTTGNHDYYIGLKSALKFYNAAGIRMLMNESVELSNGLVVAGIEDRTAQQMRLPRPDISELLKNIPEDKTVILLNHTPSTEEAERATQSGADIVLSGHTHAGQIWPFSLLTRATYRYHWGLYKTAAGHAFTSCGIGYWGPPMRIGAPPEIVLIRLTHENEPRAIR